MNTWGWLAIAAVCFEFVVAPLKIGKVCRYGLVDLLDNLIILFFLLKAFEFI